MPGFRFSPRTVLAGVELLERLTQARLSRFLLELGSEYPDQVGGESISVSKRLNNLMGVIDQKPDRLLEGGELLRDAIVEKAVSLLPPAEKESPWHDVSPPSPAAEHPVRLLEMGGFTVTEGVLHSALPAEAGASGRRGRDHAPA